ncbi:MAG: phosphodiester glycosidase family protein [Actinomycetes bacterium]
MSGSAFLRIPRTGAQVVGVIGASAVLALAVTGCGSATGASVNSGQMGVGSGPESSRSSLAPPEADGVTWKAQGSKVDGVPVTYVARPDDSISLLWMDSSILKYRYVPGYKVPENGPECADDRNPKTWMPKAAAGFNGGFQLTDNAGGYYYLGKTIRPLKSGLGTIVIAQDGTAKVGKWGRDLELSADTAVVRQNLPLVVDSSKDQTSSRDTASTWGAADAGASHTNRSAIGQLADGSLVFAFGSLVTAPELAKSLVDVGVVNAVALDMNKSWPTGFTYTHSQSKVTGSRIHPLVVRSPDEYKAQFQKDFFMAELP